MDKLFDDVARILATPMARRKAFRLLGGAVAAAMVGAVGSANLSAAGCNPKEINAGKTSCGSGKNATCCNPAHCCASKGNAAACCAPNTCVCSDGTCASSVGGVCPSGCTLC